MTLLFDGSRADCSPTIITSGTGAQFSNPSARYLAFPVAARLPDGRILVAWSESSGHYGAPVGWMTIGNAEGNAFNVAPYKPVTLAGDWATTSIAVRGTTIALLHLTTNPRRGFVQTSTDPMVWPNPTVQVQWGQSPGSWIYPCHLAWVEDGSAQGLMLAAAYTGLDGVLLSASRDSGATWQPWSRAAPHGAGWSESTITQTAQGDLLMLQRKDAGVNANTIHARRSVDHGRTWSPAVPVIPAASGLPMCTLLPDGRLVATVRDLAGPAYESWSLAWSEDHGRSWRVTPTTDGWMMYGQAVVKADGGLLLVGASQDRSSSTRSDVWVRTIREITPVLPAWESPTPPPPPPPPPEPPATAGFGLSAFGTDPFGS